MKRLLVLTAMVSSAVALLVLGCVGRGEIAAPEAVSPAGKVAMTSVVELKGLDDAGNPFNGQYGSWDEWVFDNITDNPKRMRSDSDPEGWQSFGAAVTDDGYLVPKLEMIRETFDELARGELNSCGRYQYKVVAEGPMDQEVIKARSQAINALTATYFQPVAEWVALDPPVKGMLMPNGDVICFDDRETGVETDCCGGTGELYYRYSHDGELVRTARHMWWLCYFDGGITEMPPGNVKTRADGYVIFSNDDTGEIYSIWDWDGTELELTEEPPYRNCLPFMIHPGSTLKAMYEVSNSN